MDRLKGEIKMMNRNEMFKEFLKLDWRPYMYRHIIDYDELENLMNDVVVIQHKDIKNRIIVLDFKKNKVTPLFYVRGNTLSDNLDVKILFLINDLFKLYQDNQLDLIDKDKLELYGKNKEEKEEEEGE